MKAEITQKEKKPLLNREEVLATIEFEGAIPSRLEVRKELAKAAKAKEELVIVRKMDSYYGETKLDVNAFVYDNVDSLNNTERKYMVNRHAEKKAEAAEAPAEAAPAAEAAPDEGEAKNETAAGAEPKKEAEAPKEEVKEEVVADAEKKEEAAE